MLDIDMRNDYCKIYVTFPIYKNDNACVKVKIKVC